MFDPFSARFTLRSGGYMVDVDCGYIGYGRFGELTVERLAHFGDRSVFSSAYKLRSFARGLLAELKRGNYDR